ncbi:DHHC palmitoyltransferase-domain-containing protein [Lobosporangium transversale]|uniref:Palmitoyltransferase n=1 Tax=Lobosporangium transversale TaxID=64571 RepID=A0A1Y2H5I5_9FUNG|nr:DHHC palmitoyltransferase-domain-containing protein [Lobosporangium transversale]ORZ28312.1 DHHC palmitoyltransferase-domain-containing protein [Lobosporangium transversale]|eukprot:XP_021885997.1 DHHC palmitoyltransferase-domain-containing protein [Lobosporangium transversale]
MRVAHTRTGKPLPFVVTIFPIFFYFLLIGFGYYVFVIITCVKLIRIDKAVLGAVLLVIYHITFIMMLWAYAMVILTDPGRVTAEPGTQHPQTFIQTEPQQSQQQTHTEQEETQIRREVEQGPQHQGESHIQRVQEAHMKVGDDLTSSSTAMATASSSKSLRSSGALIPGAQSANKSGYIHISEDPSVQGHPLWCSKCQHVKPERAHHCRVCKRCVLRMDHHCPWVLNCVGQDNYKFFVLFIAYTAIHCIYILVAIASLHQQYPTEEWTHQIQIAGMIVAGIFGFTLIVFTLTHVRLILLNRTTIEDHSTPRDEGVFPCLRKGWTDSEGEVNQGNERLYDIGFKGNWEQAMGKGWKCMIPTRLSRLEGPVYNEKVVARQWRDYNQQMEARQRQQQQPQPQYQSPGTYGEAPQADGGVLEGSSTTQSASSVRP